MASGQQSGGKPDDEPAPEEDDDAPEELDDAETPEDEPEDDDTPEELEDGARDEPDEEPVLVVLGPGSSLPPHAPSALVPIPTTTST